MRLPLRHLTVIFAGLLVLLPAAADVDVDASLNRDSIRVGETAELTIAISGTVSGVGRPELPAIDYLTVVSSSSQKSIELIDGRMRSTTTYTFGIRASREGTYQIPPIEVPVDDVLLTTRPLTLSVVSAATTPAPPSREVADPAVEAPEAPAAPVTDVDATLEVDSPTPWVGQQVTMTLTFMQSHRVALVGNAEYVPPDTPGLVSEALPDDSPETIWIEGTPFEVARRKTALIAPVPGEYTIGPARITFRRSYLSGEERITTDPVTLRVRALPRQGQPDDFSGVVGQLQARISSSASQVRVGEALSLRLEVSGTGDLRQLEAPAVALDGEARVDPGGAQRDISPQRTGRGYQIGGTAGFDYLIVPREAGPLTVQPVVVHYFNPLTERYESATTTPLVIDVQPGDNGQIALHEHGPELRYIREGRRGLRARPPLTARGWFWVVQLVPLLGLGYALRVRAERRHRALDPRYRRRVEAAAMARTRLRRASAVEEPAELFRQLDETLADYIASRTDVPTSSVSPGSALELITVAGAPPDLANRASQLLERLRAGAYAPAAGDLDAPEELINSVRRLVHELEGAFR